MDQERENLETVDQESGGSLTRRDLAKKAVYVAPAVLAVIAAANRPLLAGSGVPE